MSSVSPIIGFPTTPTTTGGGFEVAQGDRAPSQSMISKRSGLISVDVIPVDYEEILQQENEKSTQFAIDISGGLDGLLNNGERKQQQSPQRTAKATAASMKRIENILAASPSGLWFKITSVTCDPTSTDYDNSIGGGLSMEHQQQDGSLGQTHNTALESIDDPLGTTTRSELNGTTRSDFNGTRSNLAAHVEKNIFDEDDDDENDVLNRTSRKELEGGAGKFPSFQHQPSPLSSTVVSAVNRDQSPRPTAPLSNPSQTFVSFRSLDHLVWFQRQLLEKEPFLLIPELPVSVDSAAEDPLRAIDQITTLISTLASAETTAADPLFWSLITQADDDFFEMFRGLMYGDINSGSTSGGGNGQKEVPSLASSLVGAFRRAKANLSGTNAGIVDENGVPVVTGDRAKFTLCNTVGDATAQEFKSTKFIATDREGHTSCLAPIATSLDVADTWWECESSLTETTLVAAAAAATASNGGGGGSSSDTSGRDIIDTPMGFILPQSQKDRLLESQLVRRQRRDDELEELKKRFTEKLLTSINTHLRLPNSETKPENLSTMMLASCAIDRAFFSCDKLKEVIASSFFFQNELIRNDDLYYSWGESLVGLYKLRVALDGLQEASHGASEAWKEFCGAHYWPYTREKVHEEELKPKLSPRVHPSNRLTHYTLRSANVLAQVSQTEKGIVTDSFVSAVTTGAMLSAAHRWRCAVLHQQLHRANGVLPSARLASGGWGVVSAGGGTAIIKEHTSTKPSDKYSFIPSGPGSVLAGCHKVLSVGKPATGLPPQFVSNCQKAITPASGKSGRNLFQLQRDLKMVCEKGNGVAELESLDGIDEDSSTIQDFLDVSTTNFQEHCKEVNNQLLYPQLLSSIHEMVLYQKLSWQATEMVAKEFQRIIDDDLFLEALEEDLPFLNTSATTPVSKPSQSSTNAARQAKGSTKAAPSQSTALTTQFGSIFNKRRAAQHAEEEGEEVWRARQERMAAERLHNTHGGHYMGETTTYYSSSGGGDRQKSNGGGEEMVDFDSSASPRPYGGSSASTLEAREYRSHAIRAKVSGLQGGFQHSINDDDANPFDVVSSKISRHASVRSKPTIRSMSPKFSVAEDESSPWYKNNDASKMKRGSVALDDTFREVLGEEEDQLAGTFTSSSMGGLSTKKKTSWKQPTDETTKAKTTGNSKKRGSVNHAVSHHDDPFGDIQ